MLKPFFIPNPEATHLEAHDTAQQLLTLAQANLNAITDSHLNAPEGHDFVSDIDTVMLWLWSAQTHLEQLQQALDVYSDLVTAKSQGGTR